MHQISICIHLIYCLNIIFFLSEWVYYTVYQPLYIWILQILLLYISNNELNNSISKSINTLEINMNSQIIFNFSIFNFRNHWDIELCWWHVHVYCSRFIEFHTFCPNLIYIYISFILSSLSKYYNSLCHNFIFDLKKGNSVTEFSTVNSQFQQN